MQHRIAKIALAGAALTASPAALACKNEEQEALRELILAVTAGGIAGGAALLTAAGALIAWWWRSPRPKAPGVP